MELLIATMSANLYMAINLYHEALHEPLKGQIAICHVVRNRSLSRNMSVREVIEQDWQFSWCNEIKNPWALAIERPDLLINLFQAVNLCASQRMEGNTMNGIDHYYNPDLVETPEWATPEWSHRYVFREKIGHHKFYTDVKARIYHNPR